MAGPIVIRSRERFRKLLEKRFSLRLHMFMILTATFSASIIASKLLLAMHVHNMVVRYPIAVVCGYHYRVSLFVRSGDFNYCSLGRPLGLSPGH